MKSFCLFIALVTLPQFICGDIVSDLQGAGLTTLVDFVAKAGLVDTVKGAQPLTIFAPTNEAFAQLDAATVQALTDNPDLLKNVLLAHVVSGAIPSSALQEDNLVDTVGGTKLRVNVYQLNHHTVVTANGKQVIKPDVNVGEGSIVHVVDQVLPVVEADKTVAQVLSGDDRFGTLVAAASAANLVGALDNKDAKLTVFAPVNDAFAALPAGTVDSLLADVPELTKVLTRHVAPKVIFSKGISWAYVDTLNSEDQLYTKVFHGGRVYVKNPKTKVKAQVIDADIIASNGVIHAINAVV